MSLTHSCTLWQFGYNALKIYFLSVFSPRTLLLTIHILPVKMSYISLINMLQYRYSNMLPLLREWTAGIDPVQINKLAFCIIIFLCVKTLT